MALDVLHYRNDQELLPGGLGLLRDDSRVGKICLLAQPLNVETKTSPIRNRGTVINWGAPTWPAGGVDILRLRLNVRYGPLWKVRKPERMQREISRADGSRELTPFLLPPNVSTDAWFYPWEADLGNYFDADEIRWRRAI